nr:AC4 protein [Tomato severe rugose virus]
MGNIMTRLVRLNLTRTFTASRNIWAFQSTVDPGLPVHGPVHPLSGLVIFGSISCTGRIIDRARNL